MIESMAMCQYAYCDCQMKTSDNYCSALTDTNFKDKEGNIRPCPFYKPRQVMHFCRDCKHFIFEREYCTRLDMGRYKTDVMCAKYEGRE